MTTLKHISKILKNAFTLSILLFTVLSSFFILPNLSNTPIISQAAGCTNGATNSPTCNICPPTRLWNGEDCFDPMPPGCGNGASNPPQCDTCPSGMVMQSSVCTIAPCTNNATNPPTCDQCDPAGYMDTTTAKCLYYEKAGIIYKEFDSTQANETSKGVWVNKYSTANGYNTFKCNDAKSLTGSSHLNFDNQNYLGIKEICDNAKKLAISKGVATPRTYFYSYIYKQVNSKSGTVKYYVYTYSSYYDATNNLVTWYSQYKQDNPTSSGWLIYDGSGNKIG
jgi:hypothetical protein